jgi:S1-C subfamily serine protease
VALSLNSLALLYNAQGRYADAEPLWQRALAIWEKVLGPEHPDVATVVEHYAALLRATNRDAEAAQLEARWSAHQPPRAWLGIRMKHSTEPPGVLVEQVIAESPAAHAGIQPHDVIVRFNAQDVPNLKILLRLIEATAIRTTVDVEIIHDGQRRTIPVTLEKRPLSSP